MESGAHFKLEMGGQYHWNLQPYTYKGILNEIAGNSNTNHQAIVEFKGSWYFIYHNGAINSDGGSFSRSVCIDRLFYNTDGTVKRILMTSEGIK